MVVLMAIDVAWLPIPVNSHRSMVGRGALGPPPVTRSPTSDSNVNLVVPVSAWRQRPSGPMSVGVKAATQPEAFVGDHGVVERDCVEGNRDDDGISDLDFFCAVLGGPVEVYKRVGQVVAGMTRVAALAGGPSSRVDRRMVDVAAPFVLDGDRGAR